METFKDKKGFTLIELLAVIVVLAIVMVLATTTILPYLSKARMNSFATEANAMIDAGSKAMSLIAVGSITSTDLTQNSDYKRTSVSGGFTYCFTMKKLVELGLLTKDTKALTSSGGKYAGKVTIVTNNSNKGYTYTVKLTNGEYYVDNSGGTVELEHIKECTGTTCTTAATYNC